MSNYLRLKKMLYIVSLAAVSIVLALIEIPWPLASYLKLDFSEIAILVSLLVLGNKETVVVVIIRTIARRLFRGFDPGDVVGEMLAMFASFSIILAYNVSRKLLKINDKPLLYEVSVNGNHVGLKEMIVTSVVITLFLTVILYTVNFLIATPLYYTLPPLSLSESGNVRFTVFSFIPDSPFTYQSFFWTTFVLYTPFNIVKGILVSLVFLLLKPRMKYLEL
ncbi:MAG: ECF transporter S component [Acholeplasmataceae bacterium]|nr:ECF transporter S component [Acholeplasmataceae bacterium]